MTLILSQLDFFFSGSKSSHCNAHISPLRIPVVKQFGNSVTRLVAKYRDYGIEAIAGNHYGGNHRNMSVEEEAAILAPFKERAEKGELVEIGEIAKAYQSEVTHPVSKGQIYCVPHRHGWRKVMPRSKHPKKASDEEIAASKKLKPR